LEGNHADELSDFTALSSKFFRVFYRRYRSLRKQLSELYLVEAPKPKLLCADLTRLVELQNARDELRANPRGAMWFGARWKRDDSDSAALRKFAEWLVAFRRELLAEALTRTAVDVVNHPIDSAAILGATHSAREAASTVRAAMHDFLEYVRIEERDAFGVAFDDVAFDVADAQIEEWQQQTPALFCWSQFNAARSA